MIPAREAAVFDFSYWGRRMKNRSFLFVDDEFPSPRQGRTACRGLHSGPHRSRLRRGKKMITISGPSSIVLPMAASKTLFHAPSKQYTINPMTVLML